MAVLAGEVADGVLLNWVTPEYVERVGRQVVEAAERSGRARTALMAYVRCGILPDAEARFAEELRFYGSVPQFGQHLDRMGADAADTCVLVREATALQAGLARYEPVLDETIARAITPNDDAASILALLRTSAPS
jgi:alkanesulfonate monooxygenase SsuD/methylene tetrahydromethanopterin reductase-like flavin-dependent oxidoreductase (luciferase family)